MEAIDSTRKQAALGLEQLARLVRAQSWRADKTPALPPTQASVLRMLAGAPDGLRASRMAERLGISAASLSDTLKSLESHEWIERKPDSRDARAVVVRLGRKGSDIARSLCDPEHGIGSLLDGMDVRDLGAFLRATQWMVAQAQFRGWASGVRTCLGCRFFRPYAGDATNPHFCDFIGRAFGDAELRMDCAEQSPADESHLAASVERFRHPLPP